MRHGSHARRWIGQDAFLIGGKMNPVAPKRAASAYRGVRLAVGQVVSELIATAILRDAQGARAVFAGQRQAVSFGAFQTDRRINLVKTLG